VSEENRQRDPQHFILKKNAHSYDTPVLLLNTLGL